MRKFVDLTGQRFGKLVVLSYDGQTKDYQKLWKCICDCGNIKTIRQQHLFSGHTTTCGCGKYQLDDYTGRKFGYLTVLKRIDDYVCPNNGKHYVRYHCMCDCGNGTDVIALNLKNGSTISCGCQRPHGRFDDLSGKRFGSLIVGKRVDDYVNPSNRKLVRYLCKCDCGAEIHALANVLRKNEVNSCGCKVNSNGENFVSLWLKEHDIKYRA